MFVVHVAAAVTWGMGPTGISCDDNRLNHLVRPDEQDAFEIPLIVIVLFKGVDLATISLWSWSIRVNL